MWHEAIPTKVDSVRKLACMLEERLHKSAVSSESYCDLLTLGSRMRVVLYHLRNQQQNKKRRQSQTYHRSRQVLQQKLGLHDYVRAEWLVDEIHQRKTSLAVRAVKVARPVPLSKRNHLGDICRLLLKTCSFGHHCWISFEIMKLTEYKCTG